jgi:hypothetical protein
MLGIRMDKILEHKTYFSAVNNFGDKLRTTLLKAAESNLNVVTFLDNCLHHSTLIHRSLFSSIKDSSAGISLADVFECWIKKYVLTKHRNTDDTVGFPNSSLFEQGKTFPCVDCC